MFPFRLTSRIEGLSLPLWRVGVLAALLLFLAVRPCSAQKAAITDLVVTNSRDDLLVFFTVKDAFSKEMIEAVKNGVPMTFTYEVVLYEQRENWPDSSIAKVSIDRVMRYDSLKEEYSVSEGESESRTLTFDNLPEAIRMMSEINGFRLLPLGRLQPGGDYILRVKALLAKKELPFKLHYLIPFYSLWGFETDWRELSFRY